MSEEVIKPPLVSVVIPSIGANSYLGEALDSVFSQTYKHIEVIVVSDTQPGSPESVNVAKFCSKNSSIRLIQCESNIGAARARNLGVFESAGQFIAFLDDDDTFFPSKIEEQMQLFAKNPDLAFCYSGAKSVDDRGAATGAERIPKSNNLVRDHLFHCLASTSTWLLTKQCFNDVGGFEETISAQDAIFISKVMIKNLPIASVPKVLACYREHGGPRITGNPDKALAGQLALRLWNEKLYQHLSKEDLRLVKTTASARLLSLFTLKKDSHAAVREFRIILANAPVSRYSVLGMVKIAAPWLYRSFYNHFLPRMRK